MGLRHCGPEHVKRAAMRLWGWKGSAMSDLDVGFPEVIPPVFPGGVGMQVRRGACPEDCARMWDVG